jgi:hypothetical protein
MLDAFKTHGPFSPEPFFTSNCGIFRRCVVRDITVEESNAERTAAVAELPWTYTYGRSDYQELRKNLGSRRGDCMDLVASVTKKTLGTEWDHPPVSHEDTRHLLSWVDDSAMHTSSDSVHQLALRDTIVASGFRRVPLDSIRAGDILVSGDTTHGGHAGIYYGTTLPNGVTCPSGHLCGVANNGAPATVKDISAGAVIPGTNGQTNGHTSPTGKYDFTNNANKSGNTLRVYRPVVCST